jgi:hypothetical protein
VQEKGERDRAGRLVARDRIERARGDDVQLSNPENLQSPNYNERMIVVRYATLVALVIWVGVLVAARLGELAGRMDLLSYVCAGALVVGLFMMKFLGPPPPGFIPRVAIVLLMLVVAVASAMFAIAPDVSRLLSIVNIGLGLVLLFWYVRE